MPLQSEKEEEKKGWQSKHPDTDKQNQNQSQKQEREPHAL